MLFALFQWCSNRGSAHYVSISILGRVNWYNLAIYPRFELRQLKAIKLLHRYACRNGTTHNVPTCPAGRSNLPRWSFQLAPLVVPTCPAGRSNLPRWSFQLAPLVVPTCPAGRSNLPRWSFQLAPLVVPTCPAGRSNLPRWSFQLAPHRVKL